MALRDPYHVAGQLRRLKGRLTAALAPMAGDGWTCRRVLPRIDGTAAVEIVGPDFEATYDWVDPASGSEPPAPVNNQAQWHWGQLLPPADPNTPRVAHQVAQLLAASLARTLAQPDFAVLRWCNRHLTGLRFDDAVVDVLLADRLGPAHTRWFDHVFQEAFQSQGDRFALVFRGPHGDVELGVTTPSVTLSDGELLFEHPLFGLWLTADPRPPAERRKVAAQVERFVGFLLCRAVHPAMALQGDASGASTGGATSGGETSWRDAPVSTSRWGNPLQWHQFFSDFEIARSGLCNVQFNEPVAYVMHGERECGLVEPSFLPRCHVYARLPFAPPPTDLKAPPSQSRRFVSLITERETVFGGDDSLSRALKAAAEDEHTRLIHINNTCLPKMVGDDLDSQVARLVQLTDKPILNLNTDLDSPDASYRHMLVQAERQSRAQRDPPQVIANAVSFLGYGPGRHRQELARCLEAIDSKVAVFLLPELDVEGAWQYRAGAAQVVYPHQAWITLHAELFADLDTPVLEAPAPYGLQDTRRWLEVIATALDRHAPFENLWPEIVAKQQRRFEALRARVGDRRAGCVVTPGSASRLYRAELLYGVRLLPLLEELGFGLDVLLLATDQAAATEAEVGLRDSLSDPARLTVHPYGSPEELADRLAAAPCELVYSEVACDHRLSRAGKTGFGLDLLEMGPAGAVRSLERLLAAARWPFYRRYANHLRPRSELAPGEGGTGG